MRSGFVCSRSKGVYINGYRFKLADGCNYPVFMQIFLITQLSQQIFPNRA